MVEYVFFFVFCNFTNHLFFFSVFFKHPALGIQTGKSNFSKNHVL